MRNDIVIDAGANHGLFSLQLSARNPQRYVLAIEAEPRLAAKLEQDAHRQGLSNHEVLCVAIDEEEGPAHFHVSDLGDQGTSSLLNFDEQHLANDEYWATRPDLHHSHTIIVERKRLDTILNTLNYDEISFMKVDLQGADLAALYSLGSHLGRLKAGMIEAVSSELTSLYVAERTTMARALEFLTAHGFSIYAIKPNDPAANEYNIFFTRRGVDYREIECELSLRGLEIYDGKHFWHLPRSELHNLTPLEKTDAYRDAGYQLAECSNNLTVLIEGLDNCFEKRVVLKEDLVTIVNLVNSARVRLENLTNALLVSKPSSSIGL